MSRTNFVGVLSTLMIFSTIAQSEPLAEVNQAQELEAKTQMISMVQAQQAQYLDKGNFSSKISALNSVLNRNIPVETASYSYKTRPYHGSREKPFAISTATPKHSGLKSYTSGAFVGYAGSELTIFRIVCESLQPSRTPPAPPTLVKVKATQLNQANSTMLIGDRPQCASDSREVETDTSAIALITPNAIVANAVFILQRSAVMF